MTKQEMEKIISNEIKKDKMGKRDICSLYANRELMKEIVSYLAEPFRGKVDYVASPESLGFILGSLIANELEVGFIPIRDGKSYSLEDRDSVRASFIDHANRVRTLQYRKENIPAKQRILLVDDWVGTAATIQACKGVVESASGSVKGIASIGAEYNDATKRWIDSEELRCVFCCNKK